PSWGTNGVPRRRAGRYARVGPCQSGGIDEAACAGSAWLVGSGCGDGGGGRHGVRQQRLDESRPYAGRARRDVRSRVADVGQRSAARAAAGDRYTDAHHEHVQRDAQPSIGDASGQRHVVGERLDVDADVERAGDPGAGHRAPLARLVDGESQRRRDGDLERVGEAAVARLPFAVRRRVAIVALGIALGGGAPLCAQAPAAIAGRVTDASTDSAVAGAFVLIDGTLDRAVTDANGRYMLRDVDPGRRLVRVLRIGYQIAEHVVSLAAGDTARQNFALQRALVRLEPVTVTASRGTRSIGDVPASQAVVPAQELRNRNVLTLDQALPFVSGVSFNAGDIDIRGSTGAAGGVGSRVLLLLD